MKCNLLIVVFSLLISGSTFSQTYLRIIKRNNVTEIYPHTEIKYKAKGMGKKRAELIAMRDSLLFFPHDTVSVQDLKKVVVIGYRDVFKSFQKASFILTGGLIPLALVNQAIGGDELRVTTPLMIITGSALASGTLFWYLRHKRIRINRNTAVTVITQNFNKLQPAEKPEKD